MEVRWEREGCCALEETCCQTGLFADAGLIVAALEVKQLVKVGGLRRGVQVAFKIQLGRAKMHKIKFSPTE